MYIMNVSVLGIGWINKEEYGCVIKGMISNCRDSSRDKALSGKEIFSYPFKNFGRLDNISKLTCYAVALALKDAGIEYSVDQKQDTGIIGTNRKGSLQSDANYFNDYLKCGRGLARGNLFIYTLPSSPLGEAAIHFGLQGPLLYVTAADKPLQAALDTASEMILLDEAPAMLVGMAEEDEAVYFVLARNSDSIQHVLCDVTLARAILGKDLIFSRMIKEFSSLKEQRGQE
ncbi:MAG: beta-ketoacyl synthase N-terminal-like domain-containing protein, partial [Thermodesulfovibrionales bacterium]|nr:beta-ketoacyl synthase N-terminal-like domain-containing protein [Thermodesulfovibrionales bacterium]